MSELTLFKSGNAVPAYLQEGDSFTKQLAGNVASGKSISIEGGVWRMIVGGEEIAKNEDRAMNLVVVNAARDVARVFYDSVYVKGQVTTPACYSSDGKTPAENALRPQAPNCATCKQNIAGSGQGESRACRYFQRVAVVLEGDLEGNIYRLQLPSKSVFGEPDGGKMPFRAYAKFLAGHGVPMSGVVTEARFDTSQAVPVLRFSAARPLDREDFELIKQRSESKDALDAISVSFSDGKSSAAASAPKLFSAAPDDAEVPAKEAAIPEPTKRARKPEATTSAPKDVAALMDEWGSDDE